MKRRVGVLLSGGVAAGMNSTLQAIVYSMTLLEYEVIGFDCGWLGLMNGRYKKLTPKSVKGISSLGGGILKSCTKINVFQQEGRDGPSDCENIYNELGIEVIFILGGDGSLRQAKELSKATSMKFITLPCTLDMDVVCTEQTIGFYTAVEQASKVIVSMARV